MAEIEKIGPLRVRPYRRKGKKTGAWYVDIPASLTQTGKRQRLNFANKREAIAEARQKRREIRLQGLVSRHGTPVSGVRLCEAAKLWTDHQEGRVETLKKKRSSLVSDLYRLKPVIDFFGVDDLSRVNEARTIEYQKHRLQKGRSPATVNSEVNTLLHVMAWAKRQGFIAALPDVERVPETRRHLDLPTQDEVVRIIEALPTRLQTLVHFLAETGCRKGEAFNLEWSDVNVIQGYVDIRAKEGGWTPKTAHSQRRIYLSDGLREAFRSLPTKSRYVFPGRKRNPDKPMTDFQKALTSAVKKAKVRRGAKPMHLTPHMLRKAMMTWQAERGVPESTLQQMVGHSPGSKVTKQSYIHTTDQSKRASVLELPVGEEKENDRGSKVGSNWQQEQKKT